MDFYFFFNWNGETYVKVINNVNSLDHVDKVNLKYINRSNE